MATYSTPNAHLTVLNQRPRSFFIRQTNPVTTYNVEKTKYANNVKVDILIRKRSATSLFVCKFLAICHNFVFAYVRWA